MATLVVTTAKTKILNKKHLPMNWNCSFYHECLLLWYSDASNKTLSQNLSAPTVSTFSSMLIRFYSTSAYKPSKLKLLVRDFVEVWAGLNDAKVSQMYRLKSFWARNKYIRKMVLNLDSDRNDCVSLGKKLSKETQSQYMFMFCHNFILINVRFWRKCLQRVRKQ